MAALCGTTHFPPKRRLNTSKRPTDLQYVLFAPPRRSWHELGTMTSAEAQQEFVRQVLQLCESLDFETDVVNFLSELYVLDQVG